MMNDCPRAFLQLKRWCLGALSGISCLVLGASQASALPTVQIGGLPGFQLVQAAQPGNPPGSEQQAQAKQPSLAELNELLQATRAKLDQLFEATAAVAEQRK